jgi:putative transposase
MALKRTSHAVYDAKYPLVWAPKYRKRMTDKVRQRLRTLFPRIAQDFGFKIEAVEIAVDHVHLFLSFPPRYSIAKVVGIFKSISTSVLFKEDDRLREQLWSGEFWGDGYFARTVGDNVTATVIRRYIRHHQHPDSALKLF